MQGGGRRMMLAGMAIFGLSVVAGTALATDRIPKASIDAVELTPELDNAINTLEPEVRKRWPNAFAGLWVEESYDEEAEAGRVHSVSVAFTEAAEENVSQLAQEFPNPEVLRAVTFERSIQELETRLERMGVDREQAKAGNLVLDGVSGGDYNLGIDVKLNAIYAMVEDASAQASATFKSRYGGDVLIEEGDLGAPEACDSRNHCRPNLRSGLRVNTSISWCSSAFTVKRPNGLRKLLSAGHCSQINRGHGGAQYGQVQDQKTSGRVDAERHSVTGSFNAVPRTFVRPDRRAVKVYTRSNWNGLVVGRGVCKSGATTGMKCGEIRGKYFMPSWIPNSHRFVRTSYCADGGDSGSGVYSQANRNRVHGIHSGGSGFGDDDCSHADDWSAFGHIEFALAALGVTLVTAN